ncbi:MAG: hypothetical protein V7609_104 [Verrucomicrobiota bacterium]
MRESAGITSKRLSDALFLRLLAPTALLLLGAVIFRDFLFGDSVLLYTDIGSDSLNFSYPHFVHFSDYLRNEGFPSWSFYVGMGRDMFYLSGYLILEPVIWLPRELIAQALVYQHLLKTLAAGLMFFRFLQLYELKLPALLLGSLLLSFSAFMCMGNWWFTPTDEVVCFSALLLGTEIALKRGLWFALAVAVGLVGLLGVFYLYLCALFLLFYVPAKLFAQYGWQPRSLLRVCLILAGAAVLGVGLGSVFTIPNFYAVLNSPRGSGTASYVASLSSFPVFGFESPLHYATAISRPFANDLLGTGDGFQGWQNYVEAPATYCGLICLVILPQVFIGATPRQRIIYVLFIAAVLVTTIFPWFRYLFWLFQGDYYRTYSLFTILGMITLSMTALSNWLKTGRLNSWLLAGTVIALLAVLYFPLQSFQANIAVHLKRDVTVFLILYGALLICGQLFRWQKLAVWCVVALAAIELVHFDWLTVSNRKTVAKTQLQERIGYNDATIDAVQYIKSVDHEEFFRITKLYSSGLSRWSSLNDAMVFGYYGTSSYNNFNSVSYTNFLASVNVIRSDSEWDTRWAPGLMGHAILSIFACEKYLLTDNPVLFQTVPQYEGIRRYGGIYLFRNDLFLPFGLTFDRYFSEEKFLQLSAKEKPEALLRAVVLASDDEGKKLGLTQVSLSEMQQEIDPAALPVVVDARRNSALALNSFNQTQFAGSVRLDHRSVLLLQMPFDRGWRAFQDGKATPTYKVDAGLLGVPLDAGEHKVELRYTTPFLVHGLIVSLVSLVILAAGLWRRPRFRLLA